MEVEQRARFLRRQRRSSSRPVTWPISAYLDASEGEYVILDADSHASIYDGCAQGNAEIVRFATRVEISTSGSPPAKERASCRT